MKPILLLLTLISVISCASVSVGNDYEKYLSNNQNKAMLRKVDIGTSYTLDKKALDHKKEISSFTTGPGNKWYIEFEDIIDATFKSSDYRASFGNLEKKYEDPKGKYLKVSLIDYDFKDYRTYLTMVLEVIDNNKTVFKESYQVEGPAQGGKMFWAGAYGMKNAIQQSTMLAMNKAFSQFSNEYKAKK